MIHQVEGGAPVDRGFVIYDSPNDYPGRFVVRPFSIIGDAESRVLFQPDICRLADTLEEARKFIPQGLACFHRVFLTTRKLWRPGYEPPNH